MKASHAIERVLFGRGAESNLQSRTYAWNLASSIAYSAQSALLLLVVSRFGGLAAAGRFSIYFITTTMLASVGSYSMRNYQVSDAKGEFAYGTYLASRVVTCLAMMAMCLVYAVVWQPTAEGIATVLFLGAYRATDAVEDVFHAEAQRCGRLDAASVAHTIRIAISFAAFTLAYALTRDLPIASGSLALCSAAIVAITWPIFKSAYPQIAVKPLMRSVGRLLLVCLPICLSAVLYNFIANLPRYAIEASMPDELQGIFNILFMPVFVVDMLSMVIFNPVIADMGRFWQAGDLRPLQKIVIRQIAVIGLLSITCAAAGYAIGCPVLGFIFGADLSGWENVLALLLLLGGVSALSTFAVVLLTVMRRQAFILVGYVVAIASCVFYLEPLVTSFGLMGAGCAYGILTGVALGFFTITAIVTAVQRGKRV